MIRHDLLVKRLEHMLAALQSGDATHASAQLDDLVNAVMTTPNVLADRRVVELFNACVEAAKELRASLDAEASQHGQSQRARAAYGGR